MHKEKVTVEGINRASKLFEWTWGERIREKRSCVSYRESQNGRSERRRRKNAKTERE